MSNIHQPGGSHGVDDEFNYCQPQRCQTCWNKAKKMFFDPERARRRGITLQKVYGDIHAEAHQDGSRP
jgi:hypothetical protein